MLLIAVLGVPWIFAQNHGIAAAPQDPMELATGEIAAREGSSRSEALQLLKRARERYTIHNGWQGYRLKVTFQVDSGGQTQYDGDWEMEEIYAPGLGQRWTAKTAGYSTTQIFANGLRFGEPPSKYIPLRLHEARATLFDPVGTPNNRDIRTAAATYHGIQLTCVLAAEPEPVPTAGGGRRWDETEDCIDPETGLLQVQSVAPGRYYVYDYKDAPKLGGKTLPRNVTVIEGGRTITRVHVDSLEELSDPDPKLFAATKEMAWGVNMVGQQKMIAFPEKGAILPETRFQPVCVMGLITPEGQLVDAHVIDPSDPNSAAAVDYAKSMHFATPNPVGGEAQQRFVFIIEKFPARSATAR